MNQLYFGDNLDILKDLYAKHPEGYIDLIYIDPPFNSKRNYNVLFEDIEMEDTKAQKEAFADTWSNVSYYDALEELKESDLDLHTYIHALDNIRISKGAIAYLTTMAIRIYYMHKLLKDTGSFYLHCDPTMSHYLKIICDIIYGEGNFRNEITWQRTNAHSDSKQGRKAYGNISDLILFYSKSTTNTFNTQYLPYSKEYLKKFYKYEDDKGRYSLGDIAAPGGSSKGNPYYEFLGIKRYWRFSKKRMEKLYNEGMIIQLKKGNVPRQKRYLDTNKGIELQNIWTDIKPLQHAHAEKMGYPTQKPLALMERILKVSSNEGDVVADFFCGCGTTIAASEKLNRKWIGADISHLAIKLISKRLTDTYGSEIRKEFEIFGFPKDIASAHSLASDTRSGRFKFEEWIIEVMLHGILNPRKTETGYDGYFTLDVQGKKDVVLVEVKSGNASLTQLNHFIKTVETKDAHAGVFVCFEEQITRGMLESAKKQGYYRKEFFQTGYDKIQVLTVEDLMDGKLANLPSFDQSTFASSKKVEKENKEQGRLFE